MIINGTKSKKPTERARAKQIRAEIHRLQAEMNRIFNVPEYQAPYALRKRLVARE
jgi:hypothetical protein